MNTHRYLAIPQTKKLLREKNELSEAWWKGRGVLGDDCLTGRSEIWGRNKHQAVVGHPRGGGLPLPARILQSEAKQRRVRGVKWKGFV